MTEPEEKKPTEKSETEEKRPSEESEKPKQPVYVMKGIPVHAYLTETGEFRWIPAFEACGDREKARRIVEVLKKIPSDRRAVWAQRLDLEEAKITCPVIRDEVGLCKEFDDLCTAYRKPLTNKESDEKRGEVNSRNE